MHGRGSAEKGGAAEGGVRRRAGSDRPAAWHRAQRWLDGGAVRRDGHHAARARSRRADVQRQGHAMIAILVTGGTFDKQYNELAGTLAFKETHVPEMLRLGRCRVEVAVRQLMMIDSLEMTDSDRAEIAKACVAAPESRIVITHGTDTMVETARTLAAALVQGAPEGGQY